MIRAEEGYCKPRNALNDSGKRCVVHIGSSKAGSTTIQYWLKKNTDILRTRGFAYDPLTYKIRRFGAHHGFAAMSLAACGRLPNSGMFLERYRIETLPQLSYLSSEFEARANKSISAGHFQTYVISSEHLFHWLTNASEVEWLHHWLSSRFERIHYVVYLRDQIDWIASAYAQSIKDGGVVTLDEFVERRGRINYYNMCRMWEEATGEANISVRLLAPDFLTDGDLITDFAAKIGTSASGTRSVRMQNKSLNARSLEFIRRLNHQKSRTAQSIRFASILISQSAFRNTPSKPQLTKQQQNQIAKWNASSNEKLRNWLFPQRTVLFAKSSSVLKNTLSI